MVEIGRRKHGCDCCHKDMPTELFIGYRHNVLWICEECYKILTNEIPRFHRQSNPIPKIYNREKIRRR